MEYCKLKPLIKYTGNKYSEYKQVKEYLPEKINNYYEPFFGGGGIFFQLHNDNKIKNMSFINDLSNDLMAFYRNICQDELVIEIERISNAWDDLSIVGDNIYEKYKESIEECIYENLKTDKFIENGFINFIKFIIDETEVDIYKNKGISLLNYISKTMIEKLLNFHSKHIKGILNYDESIPLHCVQTSVHQSFYNMIRDCYNDWSSYNPKTDFNEYEQIAQWYFIRNYCFGGMFRYSNDGVFNVPYGGYSYNNKSIEAKLELLRCDRLKWLFANKVTIHNEDYKRFLKCRFKKDDFIFLDPPYDTTFSEYDMNEFSVRQHEELSDILKSIKCKWMLVVQKTPLMCNLYKDYKYIEYDKKYRYRAKGKYNNEVKHMIIKNY